MNILYSIRISILTTQGYAQQQSRDRESNTHTSHFNELMLQFVHTHGTVGFFIVIHPVLHINMHTQLTFVISKENRIFSNWRSNIEPTPCVRSTSKGEPESIPVAIQPTCTCTLKDSNLICVVKCIHILTTYAQRKKHSNIFIITRAENEVGSTPRQSNATIV